LSILTKRFLFLFIFSALLFSVKNAAAQVQFVENKGQWNQKVNYRGDFGTGSFFLEHKGFTVLLNKPEDVAKLSQYMHGEGRDPKTNPADTFTFHSFAYNVTFLGAAEYPKAVPDKSLPTYNNYFIGNDQSKWAGECKIFTAVTYKDVYPNIDVRYYSTNEQLKYDFIVHPGGNPAAIALRYDGVKKLSVKDKELIIGTSLGDVKELAPFTYQANTPGSGEVEAKYVVRDNVVTFDIKKYDPSVTLVIDPQIIFSSFTGSTADNWGYTATPGPDGSFFAGGIVFAAGYPVSPGAFQTQFHGGSGDGIFPGVDMGIFKFSPNGSTRVYATYIGGNGDEQPHSMIADPQGNLIIAGRSNSSNYPELTPLNLRSTNYDIVVTKLNAAGSALIGSVRLGGTGNDGVNIRPKYVQPFGADRLRRNYGDDARSEVILDAAGNIYVSSCTQSSDFNGMAGSAIQPVFGGTQDGVILKFNPNLSGVLFQTYFGGSNDDACFVAAIDPITSNLYVGGATSSTTLPGNKTGVIQGTNAGGLADGFVTILRPDGSAIIKTTFLGTGGIDIIYGLKFDKVGSPYVMGTTTGTWPVVNAAYSVAGSKQFISKLKTDLSAFDYSTVFGTSSAQPNISPIAFLVDRCENVYVSGWGGGINTDQGYSTGNTTNMPEINPLTGIPGPDGRDFYFFVLKKDAQTQLFGSHFGQNGGLGDHVDGGTSRFDANGVIYQAICANCESGYKSSTPIPFPVTTGVWSTRNESAGCNEAAVKINMNFSGVGAEIQSIIDGVANDTLGCIPLTVNFKDLQQRGVTYYWNFNSTVNPAINDQTTTVPQTSFTFTVPGVYRVRLISEDLNTCNLRDTSYITIKAGDNRVTPSFTRIKLGACTSNQYQFTNTSVNSQNTSFGPQSFVWNYGDGSANDTAALTPPRIHTFPGPGTYFVSLTVIDPAFCNAPDTLRDTLRINPTVDARPSGPALGCAPFDGHFSAANSLAGITWKWEFYDAATNTLIGTSTDFEPTFPFPNIGSYKYRLIAFDPTTCNLVDTSEFLTLQVLPKPTAAAGWGPNPPQANVPVSFTNGSVNANRYLWEFGDGENSTQRAPVHEYNATGTYNAYLVAYNEAGCTDTAFLVVDVIVNPLLDVPNAFTPGRFGSNGIVSVRGFGIGKMAWKIYNRWGQVVFESTTKRSGWNGYYKGVLQPTDVYTYTLDVEFTDGKKLRKTGDITLLR
jgi:gliding motility-associated-like protein